MAFILFAVMILALAYAGIKLVSWAMEHMAGIALVVCGIILGGVLLHVLHLHV